MSAQNLDNSAAALHNNTTTLSHRPHTVRVIARGSSHPQQWQNFTEVNIAKAEKERDNSKNLRSATDGVLRQTTGTFTYLDFSILIFSGLCQNISRNIQLVLIKLFRGYDECKQTNNFPVQRTHHRNKTCKEQTGGAPN